MNSIITPEQVITFEKAWNYGGPLMWVLAFLSVMSLTVMLYLWIAQRKGGFIKVPDRPGFGIDELNEKLIAKHPCKDFPPPWTATDEWNKEWANDRRWS